MESNQNTRLNRYKFDIPGFLKRSNQSPMNNYEQKRQKKDDLFAYRSKDYSETTSNASSYRSELLNHEAPSIENIIDNQMLIFQKIDKLVDLVKKIESKLENKNHQFDQKTIESHVKIISTELLNNYIYPTQSEMINEATDYYKNNDGEWYHNKFENNDLKFFKWYEKTLSEKLNKTIRSLRGTLVAKIKENIFVTFKGTLKKMINTNATPNEIINWKNSIEVKECYRLLDEINEESNKSFFQEILNRTFLKHGPSLPLIAFTHAVAVLILDPGTNTISIKENLIKTHMGKFMQNWEDDDDDCGRSGNMADIIQIKINMKVTLMKIKILKKTNLKIMLLIRITMAIKIMLLIKIMMIKMKVIKIMKQSMNWKLEKLRGSKKLEKKKNK